MGRKPVGSDVHDMWVRHMGNVSRICPHFLGRRPSARVADMWVRHMEVWPPCAPVLTCWDVRELT